MYSPELWPGLPWFVLRSSVLTPFYLVGVFFSGGIVAAENDYVRVTLQVVSRSFRLIGYSQCAENPPLNTSYFLRVLFFRYFWFSCFPRFLAFLPFLYFVFVAIILRSIAFGTFDLFCVRLCL